MICQHKRPSFTFQPIVVEEELIIIVLYVRTIQVCQQAQGRQEKAETKKKQPDDWKSNTTEKPLPGGFLRFAGLQKLRMKFQMLSVTQMAVSFMLSTSTV